MKVKAKAVKIYKPEIMLCPVCKNNLKYVYTVSNRVVQFSSGKIFRIKNMGYKCPQCNDNVFFSLTALKLAFKGYTYSAKLSCMVEYYKSKNMTREKICDMFAENDIEISDRNIDMIYNKVKSYLDMDYDTKITEAYSDMMDKFKEIRICLDLITVEKTVYIVMYSYFSGDVIALWKFDSIDDEKIPELLRKYCDNKYNITTIVTVRPQFRFYGIVKENVPARIKLMSYSKF
jgi:hypothetical protein